MAIDYEKLAQPATRGEVGFLAADVALGLRMVMTALLMLKHGDEKGVMGQLDTIGEHVETIWKKYKELTGQDADNG